MSKKHFNAIAFALWQVMPSNKTIAYKQWLKDCEQIAIVCANENANFDHDRFIQACKGE